ncbi:MAG: hypothetical protein ABSA32_12940 [Candidatus Acidiferrales bacterium]
MEIPAKLSPAKAVRTEDPEQNTRQRAHAILFWAAAAVAAVCIDFGAFHRLHNSDSIVPVLVSLYRWTPFYWDQDRFGMLVPLLALPFRNPLANLLVQSAINVFCGLGAFFLCARYVAPRAWLFTGAFSAAFFLLFNRPDTRFLYLGPAQPYGVGMFLGLGGLLLLENVRFSRPLRITCGFISLLAASWVDAAVMFVLLPLIFFRWYFISESFERGGVLGFLKSQPAKDGGGEGSDSAGGRRRIALGLVARARRFFDQDAAVAAAFVFCSFVASYLYSGIVSYSAAYGDWPYPPVQPWKLPAVWLQFGKNVWFEYLMDNWGIAVAVMLAFGVVVRLVLRGRNARTNTAAITLIASAVVSFLLIGSLSHVQGTEYDPRFALQSMVLLQIGAIAWALLPIYDRVGASGRRATIAAAMILFLAAPLYLYGRPSLGKVRADLDGTLGAYTPEILQSGATHILGDYWKVWPATYHANLTLYEMGSDRRIWGVTDRSAATREFWSAIPPEKMRLATVAGDPSVPYVLNMYSFPPLEEEQRLADIVILRPAPTPADPR